MEIVDPSPMEFVDAPQKIQGADIEMGFAKQVADRIVVMESGRIIEEGKPEQIFTAPRHEVTRATRRCSALNLA